MAHTYLLFDFGSDEEKAQQARHKLENWKQAFRLDKKLLYKLERDETEAAESAASAAQEEESAAPATSSKASSKSAKTAKAAKAASKSKAKSKSKSSEEGESTATPSDGNVNLVVRLYFSGHEKLTEQRLLDRIPNEEPFKDASPRVVRQGEPQFDELVQQFESLE